MKLVKKFIGYYRPYRGLFVADMICAMIVAGIDLVFPQILNVLTKDIFLRSANEVLYVTSLVALGLLGLYVIKYFAMYFITSWGHIMGAHMERDMRRDLFTHYQRLSFSYYDRNNTGEMMSRIVADLFDVTELAHHGPENILIASIKIIGAFAVLFTINVNMTLILLAVTSVIVVFSYFQNRKMHAAFRDNRQKIAKVNSGLMDSLGGIREVKSFANEQVEQSKFAGFNAGFFDSKKSSYKVMGFFHSTNAFFQSLLYIIILVSGAYFIGKGEISPTQLAIYALYIGIFLHPIDMLLHFSEMFQRGFSGFQRLVEILEQIPEIEDRPNAKELDLSRVKGTVSYRNVNFFYDKDIPVLHDISFDMLSGKTVALVGASGGGKSTICSLLPRFYDLKSGEILLDGVSTKEFTLQSLRRAIGVVQQDVYIFSGTVRENIMYGKVDATEEELVAAAKRANIHDFILSLPNGYESELGERGVRLSGGQKQRLSIARVFLKNPPILILDEATSALDNESERKIQKSLVELSKGRTTLVIAHRLSTIQHADDIVVIESGRIAERGTHENLLALNGVYAKYYELSQKS